MITEKLLEDMIVWRRDFHQHPELGFDEHRTAARVAELLTEFGLDVSTGLGGTGVVGVLQKGNSTASIGLRADMDALPINELNTFAHASTTPDVMHACGHDGHTSMLLGAAKHLAQSGDFNGRVVFIFQPNEEHGLGAPAMLEGGFLEQYPIDQVFGLHNIPGMALKSFGTRSGPMTASENLFEITIHAKGGHAALPHMGVDAIVVGAEIVSSVQTIVSRKLNPGLNGVVSITEFETDGARNVLPGKAVLKGDARALTVEINEAIEANLRQVVKGVCEAHGVTADVLYETHFPPVINSADASRAACEAAMALAGNAGVDTNCPPKLFSEDFAHFASAVPGNYILMGNGETGAHAQPLHSADYDFNDDALVPGSSYWVSLVEQQLSTDS